MKKQFLKDTANRAAVKMDKPVLLILNSKITYQDIDDYFIAYKFMNSRMMVYLLNFIKNYELISKYLWNISFVGIEIKNIDRKKKILEFEYIPGLENFVRKDDQNKYNIIGLVFEYQNTWTMIYLEQSNKKNNPFLFSLYQSDLKEDIKFIGQVVF